MVFDEAKPSSRFRFRVLSLPLYSALLAPLFDHSQVGRAKSFYRLPKLSHLKPAFPDTGEERGMKSLGTPVRLKTELGRHQSVNHGMPPCHNALVPVKRPRALPVTAANPWLKNGATALHITTQHLLWGGFAHLSLRACAAPPSATCTPCPRALLLFPLSSFSTCVL